MSVYAKKMKKGCESWCCNPFLLFNLTPLYMHENYNLLPLLVPHLQLGNVFFSAPWKMLLQFKKKTVVENFFIQTKLSNWNDFFLQRTKKSLIMVIMLTKLLRVEVFWVLREKKFKFASSKKFFMQSRPYQLDKFMNKFSFNQLSKHFIAHFHFSTPFLKILFPESSYLLT